MFVYSTIEREALAVVTSIKAFYLYLYGFQFQLVTDHNPLTSLKNLRNVGGRLTCWTLFLQQFSFSIQYKPGRLNGNEDALSRVPPQEDVVAALGVLDCLGSLDLIRQAQADDAAVAAVVSAIRQGGASPSYLQNNGVVCHYTRESCVVLFVWTERNQLSFKW